MKSSELTKHYFFSPFNSAELVELVGKSTRRSFPAGETIFRQEESSASCFWLEFGSIRLGKKGPRHSTDKAVLGPGSLFGELAFLDRRPRLQDAVALEAVSVVEIPYDAIQALIERSPKLAEKLFRAMALFLWDKLQHQLQEGAESLARFQ